MTIDDKIAFYVSMFSAGLSTGLFISFVAWCVKRVIEVFKIITDTEGGVKE